MFEHRKQPLLPRQAYLMRLAWHAARALSVVVIALGIGVVGYHVIAGMAWIDSFLNAAMILGGMGPVGELQTTAAKAFAGCYALFSGLAFIVVVGLMFAPVVHRFLHRFHLEAGERDPDRE
jgi:hypothetical protein